MSKLSPGRYYDCTEDEIVTIVGDKLIGEDGSYTIPLTKARACRLTPCRTPDEQAAFRRRNPQYFSGWTAEAINRYDREHSQLHDS